MFEFLEEYVVADEFEDHDKKHTFYPVKEEEIDADLHIYVKLSGKQQGNVFLGKRKIADSIKYFVDKVTQTSNYFLK